MQNNEPNERASREQDLARLERPVERGTLFTHTIVSQNADRIHEVEFLRAYRRPDRERDPYAR